MNEIVWKRKNGVIIGCEKDGIEYNLFAIYNNETFYKLYHEQLEKDSKERDKE